MHRSLEAAAIAAALLLSPFRPASAQYRLRSAPAPALKAWQALMGGSGASTVFADLHRRLGTRSLYTDFALTAARAGLDPSMLEGRPPGEQLARIEAAIEQYSHSAISRSHALEPTGASLLFTLSDELGRLSSLKAALPSAIPDSIEDAKRSSRKRLDLAYKDLADTLDDLNAPGAAKWSAAGELRMLSVKTQLPPSAAAALARSLDSRRSDISADAFDALDQQIFLGNETVEALEAQLTRPDGRGRAADLLLAQDPTHPGALSAAEHVRLSKPPPDGLADAFLRTLELGMSFGARATIDDVVAAAHSDLPRSKISGEALENHLKTLQRYAEHPRRLGKALQNFMWNTESPVELTDPEAALAADLKYKDQLLSALKSAIPEALENLRAYEIKNDRDPFPIRGVLVVGSVAHGQPRPQSDLDYALVADRELDDSLQIASFETFMKASLERRGITIRLELADVFPSHSLALRRRLALGARYFPAERSEPLPISWETFQINNRPNWEIAEDGSVTYTYPYHEEELRKSLNALFPKLEQPLENAVRFPKLDVFLRETERVSGWRLRVSRPGQKETNLNDRNTLGLLSLIASGTYPLKHFHDVTSHWPRLLEVRVEPYQDAARTLLALRRKYLGKIISPDIMGRFMYFMLADIHSHLSVDRRTRAPINEVLVNNSAAKMLAAHLPIENRKEMASWLSTQGEFGRAFARERIWPMESPTRIHLETPRSH